MRNNRFFPFYFQAVAHLSQLCGIGQLRHFPVFQGLQQLLFVCKFVDVWQHAEYRSIVKAGLRLTFTVHDIHIDVVFM